MTGLSRVRVTRLAGRYIKHSEVKEARIRRQFPSLITRGDIELPAKMDEAHDTISGAGTSGWHRSVPSPAPAMRGVGHGSDLRSYGVVKMPGV